MNCIYLIDFGSVGEKGFRGIERIDPSDRVHVFYSAVRSKMSLECVEMLRKHSDRIILHKTAMLPGVAAMQLSVAFGQFVSKLGLQCVFVITKRMSVDLITPMENIAHTKYSFASSLEECSIPDDKHANTKDECKNADESEKEASDECDIVTEESDSRLHRDFPEEDSGKDVTETPGTNQSDSHAEDEDDLFGFQTSDETSEDDFSETDKAWAFKDED